MENVLQLLLACLTFDFIGTAPEESTDDTGTLQIPTAWRPGILRDLSSILTLVLVTLVLVMRGARSVPFVCCLCLHILSFKTLH